MMRHGQAAAETDVAAAREPAPPAAPAGAPGPAERRSPRHALLAEARLERQRDGAALPLARTADISAGGMFVRCEQVEPPGTRLRFRVTTKGPRPRSFLGEGEVVWTRPPPQAGMGIRFETVDKAGTAIVAEFDARRQTAIRLGESVAPSLYLSPAELAPIVADAARTTLSPMLAAWVARYRDAGGRRDDFLWRWCLKGLRMTALPCVEPDLREPLNETKLLNVMFATLLDDIADETRDADMLAAALEIPRAGPEGAAAVFARFDEPRRRYLEEAAAVWREIWARAAAYPRFPELRDLLDYDFGQLFNAIRYALIVNRRPAVFNLAEHDLYQPHNMTIMIMATLDLCGSPAFDLAELGAAREVFWHAQRMGRIGNMVTTWERELRVRDFSSGVFAWALADGVLAPQDLERLPAAEIARAIRAGGCEDHFLVEWEGHRDAIRNGISRIRSVDLSAYAAGFEALIKMDLGSRGLV